MTEDQAPMNYTIVSENPQPYSTHWFLCNYFSDWTAQDIEIAVAKDFRFEILGCGNQILDHISNEFLKWAGEFRPEFVKPLSSWKGKKWLHKNIRNMISQL